MSVSLNPNNALGFPRPLTVLVNRSLTISNHNSQSIAFKVKTTAPKLYCVRPNSGRVDPGGSIDVSVMLQALKEEPPLNAKCKDKFLIQSTFITPEKESMPLQDIWNTTDGKEESKVYQQKLRVVYLPAEGQTVEEEDEGQVNMSSMMNPGESHFDTVRQHASTNGHTAEPIPEFNVEPPADPPKPQTPPPLDYSVSREESHDKSLVDVPAVDGPAADTIAQPPSPPSPHADLVPAPLTSESSRDPDLLFKYKEAIAEIEHLKSLLASTPSLAPTELRRRTNALSDDGGSPDTDVATIVEEGNLQQVEGVPLQVVVIIALGVFITTYLFF